jgi:hypothetical protein
MTFSNTGLSSEGFTRIPDLPPKTILNLVMNSRKYLNVTFYSSLHHAAESKKRKLGEFSMMDLKGLR